MAHYDSDVSLSADVTFFIKGCFQVNSPYSQLHMPLPYGCAPQG